MFPRSSHISGLPTPEGSRKSQRRFSQAASAVDRKKRDTVPESKHHKIHSRFGRKAEKPGVVIKSSLGDQGKYLSPTKRVRTAEDGQTQQLVFIMNGETFYADQSPQVQEPLVPRLRGQSTYYHRTSVTTFQSTHRHITKPSLGTMPLTLSNQRKSFAKAFNNVVGELAKYESTHIIGKQFHREAGTNSFIKENIVHATEQTNSAMTMFEDVLKKLAKHYGIQLFYWGEIKHFTDVNLAESITLCVSIESPVFESTPVKDVLSLCHSPYFTIQFNALLNTRPVKSHENIIFDVLVSFIESEKQRLRDEAFSQSKVPSSTATLVDDDPDEIPPLLFGSADETAASSETSSSQPKAKIIFDFFAPVESTLKPKPPRGSLKPLSLFSARSSSQPSALKDDDSDDLCLSLPFPR